MRQGFNRKRIAIGLVALLLGACGNSEPDRDPQAPIPLDDYGQAFGAAVCERIFHCCAGSEIELMFSETPANEAACIPLASRGFTMSQEAIELAVAAQHVTYSPAQAAACVAAIAAIECADFVTFLPPPACTGIFVGHVEDGASCAINEECGPASLCLGVGGPVCVPRGAPGESCTEAPCQDGAHCTGSAAPPAPPPTCEADYALGEACQVGSQCGSDTCGDNQCVAKPPLCHG